jgi:catechol 2,3-dioxygenase-like lactoylglutathione lyase family enzyme
MIRIHHVNLGILPGGTDDETAFLYDVGYRQLPGPAEFPNAKWFEASDGSQVHLSEDPEHQPAARAHVAVVLVDELDEVVERLQSHGTNAEIGGFGGVRVAICLDPAGNRWELRDR